MAFDYAFHTENSAISGGVAAADVVPVYDDSTGRWMKATGTDLRAVAHNGLVNATAATLTVTKAAHSGSVITLNRAGGIAVTLPAATGSGDKYRFIIGTTFTSSATIKVVGDDIMHGVALLSQDSADTAVLFETSTDTDTITFDGTTTGGYVGTNVELIDIAADTWFVSVVGKATGTEATPFSATVT